MTIDLLDAPLRVTWDLHGKRGALNEEAARRVAGALTAAGVFFVTLEERPLVHSAVREILSVLSSGGCQTLLICDGRDEELATLTAGLPLGALFLNARAFLAAGEPDLDALSRAVEGIRQRGHEPGLLMTPLRGNLHAIPDLLAFCRQAGVGKFKLPNIKIGGSFWRSLQAELLRPEDLERFRSLLGDDPAALREGVDLEVHDLFLWELLFPDRDEGRSEYGGCQAGNSLAHVDEIGNLYPCSSWPERLGSLLQQPLAELWRSALRFRVREEIAATPPGCAGCRDYPICLGGCRGLARTLNRAAGGRDPLCSGPR